MNDRIHHIQPTPQKRAGLLESAMLKLFTRSAQVLDIEDIGDAFRIVTLGGEALRNVEWTPGDKIQIQLGGWTQRTYTPIDWDAESGSTRFLAYLHGDGPGSRWVRDLRKGDACVLFGPRKSIKIARPHASLILFGDETSLGLAAALSRQAPRSTVQMLFEVSQPAETMPVIEHLQLDGIRVCTRLENDAHVVGMRTKMSMLLETHPKTDIVLTGKASSIQHMSSLLRQYDVVPGRRQSKAYWAPGKTGMD
jgi:NADPH-dependent ferric siderophore reductase